jgi:hypothetical protein
MGKNNRKRDESQVGDAQLALRLPELVREGLREVVHTAGMLAVEAILEEERTALCGPRGEHQSDRACVRGGHARGALCLGGRRVAVKRPRVRSTTGGEVKLPCWEQFRREDPLRERALEQMVCRRENIVARLSRSLRECASAGRARAPCRAGSWR